MKKVLLVGVVTVAVMAASSQARAGGLSFSISLGHHHPYAPVYVAPPPVIVAPPVVAYGGHCGGPSIYSGYDYGHRAYHHRAEHRHQAFHHRLEHRHEAYHHRAQHGHQRYHHRQHHYGH